ncbi:MAG: hypothetical protein IJI43_00690 [Bacilli bacterium]|nr:hypothetical protein [Bacilli bacterium]
MEPSYAVEEDSEIPENTFTSNINNNSVTNYVKEALTSSGTSSNFSDSFAVPSNMKINNSSTPLYKLSKNYDTPTVTEQFELINVNPTSITDKGLAYILSHGYVPSNTNHDIFSTGTYGSVSNSSIKQYITQVALWLYIYEKKSSFTTTYCANNGCDFLNTSGTAVTATSVRDLISTAANASNFKYLNYINLLVDKAKSYSGDQSSQISLNGTSLEYQINPKYTLLVTDTVTPTITSNKDNFMYYSVEIDDPNNYGVYIVDKNNKRITNLDDVNGAFKIAIPLKEDITTMDLSSIEIHVLGHFIRDKGLAYRVTSKTTGELTKHDIFSDVLLGYVPTEVVEDSITLYNFVKISKIDVTNSSELPGATLEITNKSDESKKYTWISSATPYYIYLEDGDYSLCETLAPQGYSLNKNCIDFTVDNTKIVSVTMENKPYVASVPNTGLFISKIAFYLGIISLLVGLMIVGIIFVTKEKKSV